MFQCTVNGKTFETNEWFFGEGDNFIKLLNANFNDVNSAFPKKTIITNVKITDTTQPDYLENFDVYLSRKSIVVETQTISKITESEGTQHIDYEDVDVIIVTLNTPTSDLQIQNVANYVGYVMNPDSLSLEEYKNYTINNSKNELANYLLAHPLQSDVHKSILKNYAITENKQILLLMELMCAQQAQEASIPYQPSWNASGEACTYDWTIDELKTLAFQINQVVKPLISYQQSIEEQIISKETITEIKSIVVDFASHDPRNSQLSDNEGSETEENTPSGELTEDN